MFHRNRRSRSHHRRSHTPPTTPAQKIEMSAAQQAQITQFLSASLSGIQPSSTVHSIAQHMPQPEPVRTDFSNLFHSISTSSAVPAGPNASALAIAAAKAKDLLRSKNLTDTMKVTSNGNSIASNGNDSSREGKRHFSSRVMVLIVLLVASEFRNHIEHENSASGLCNEASNSGGDRKRKKKSRWASSNDSCIVPGMPTILPSNLNADQQEAYLGNYKLVQSARSPPLTVSIITPF